MSPQHISSWYLQPFLLFWVQRSTGQVSTVRRGGRNFYPNARFNDIASCALHKVFTVAGFGHPAYVTSDAVTALACGLSRPDFDKSPRFT